MKVKVIWCAFEQAFTTMGKENGRAEFVSEVDVPAEIQDKTLVCDAIFKWTNTYSGAWFKENENKFPKNRSHTAISVGDEIEVDGEVFKCADFGWEKVVANV